MKIKLKNLKELLEFLREHFHEAKIQLQYGYKTSQTKNLIWWVGSPNTSADILRVIESQNFRFTIKKRGYASVASDTKDERFVGKSRVHYIQLLIHEKEILATKQKKTAA